MKNRIKDFAIEYGLHEFKLRCGLYVDKLDKTFLKELSNLLPVHHNPHIKGRVDSVETTSFEAESSSYYPKGSFYRVSIIYSGNIPKEDTQGTQFFFRNSTVHYDKDMNFITVQHHHNKESYNWLEYSSQFENIFK